MACRSCSALAACRRGSSPRSSTASTSAIGAWAAYSTTEELAAVLHLVTVGAWSIVVVEWLTGAGTPRLSWLLTVWLIAIPAVGAARAVARGMCKQATAYRQNTVIVGAGDVGQLVARKLLQHPEYGINVVGFVDDAPRAPPRARSRAAAGRHGPAEGARGGLDVERVIVAFSAGSDAETVGLVRAVNELDRDVQIDLVPRLFELVGPRACDAQHRGPDARRAAAGGCRARRGWSSARSTLGLGGRAAVTAPLFAFIALRIKLDSPGPVFFRQTRLGPRHARVHLLKFRTMTVDTDAAEHRAYIRETMTAAAAPRANGLYKLDRSGSVTRVGRWLRRTSLDELPQLINVLRGDMSLVGPRPVPRVRDASTSQPHHFERFLVPAGPDRPLAGDGAGAIHLRRGTRHGRRLRARLVARASTSACLSHAAPALPPHRA